MAYGRNGTGGRGSGGRGVRHRHQQPRDSGGREQARGDRPSQPRGADPHHVHR